MIISTINVGRIIGLWRYPVKSMGPEALDVVDISWFGLAGDRRWAFVRNDAIQSGFPWLTIRECANMQNYQPTFVDPSRPDKSATVVRTPSGKLLELDDPELGAALYSGGAQVIKQNRGNFDTFPLSLITTETIAGLENIAGFPLNVQRFRPNFLVETNNSKPFPEDQWIGSILRIGSLRFRLDKRDGRCAVINVDPATSEKNPEVLRAVASQREGCLGAYGTVVTPGKVAIGDTVFLEMPVDQVD